MYETLGPKRRPLLENVDHKLTFCCLTDDGCWWKTFGDFFVIWCCNSSKDKNDEHNQVEIRGDEHAQIEDWTMIWNAICKYCCKPMSDRSITCCDRISDRSSSETYVCTCCHWFCFLTAVNRFGLALTYVWGLFACPSRYHGRCDAMRWFCLLEILWFCNWANLFPSNGCYEIYTFLIKQILYSCV